MKPVSEKLNSICREMARRVWPLGYDPSPDAPSTFKALQREAACGRIRVFDGACENTIFADKETNIAFRAWHDWCHLFLGAPFDLAGECDAFELQAAHIRQFYGDAPDVLAAIALLRSDVVGQSEYYAETKSFVDDQRAFTLEYMAHFHPAEFATL